MNSSLSFAIPEQRRKAVWGPRRLALLAVLAMLAAWFLGPTLSAQGPLRAKPIVNAPLSNSPITIEPLDVGSGAFRKLRSNSRAITVYGIVRNHLGSLVPKAGLVVIRRLDDGRAIATTPVDEHAQFAWRGIDPGMYAAELVDDSGSVIATSAAFTANYGEVIQLAPVIPVSPVSGFSAWLSSATDAAINSANGAGVLAVSSGLPVSPR